MAGGSTDAIPELLRGRPELHEGYVAFRDTIVQESGLDPILIDRCRARVHWVLTARADEPVARDASERAVFAYADAFVRDPHAVSDAHVAALRERLTVPQIVGLTEALALLDGFTRFHLILGTAAR